MSKQTAISRYLLIIKRLQKRKQNFEQLFDYLEQQSEIRGYKCTLEKRSFQREINEIREIFGIDIKYSRAEKVYFINEEDSPETLQQDRLLEAYELLNILDAAEKYKDKLFFESRKARGVEHVFGFLHAIKNKLITKSFHTNFVDNSEYQKELKPIALKESQGRWYVIAFDIENENFNSFALDRVKDLEITKLKFENIDFNVENWFKYYFGVNKGNEIVPSKIKLSFTHLQGQYIKSYPLHWSQNIEFESLDKDEVIASLELYVSDDFMMELLKYGNEVKVLAPESLAKRMKIEYRSALHLYK